MNFSPNCPMTPFDESAIPDVWDLPRDFDYSTGIGRSVEGIEFKLLQGDAVPLACLASIATSHEVAL